MLVLSGKKIKYGLFGIFAICLVATITLSINKQDNEYIETVNLPVSGKVVVVDAGHRHTR